MKIEIEIKDREFERIAESCPFAYINEECEERWCCLPLSKTDKACSIDDCPFIYWIENV